VNERIHREKIAYESRLLLLPGQRAELVGPTAVAFACDGANVVGIDICAPVYPPSGVESAGEDDLSETGRRVEAAGVRWLNLIVDQRDMPALGAVAARFRTLPAKTRR